MKRRSFLAALGLAPAVGAAVAKTAVSTETPAPDQAVSLKATEYPFVMKDGQLFINAAGMTMPGGKVTMYADRMIIRT